MIAFGVPLAEQTTEGVAIALESRAGGRTAALVERVHEAVSESFGITVAGVRVLPPGSLPATATGKLMRGRCRELYLAGELTPKGSTALGALRAAVRRRVRRLR